MPKNKIIQESEVDLFEHYEKLPSEVQGIISKCEEQPSYNKLEKMLEELKPYGYTFEYGLDAVPYDLRKL